MSRRLPAGESYQFGPEVGGILQKVKMSIGIWHTTLLRCRKATGKSLPEASIASLTQGDFSMTARTATVGGGEPPLVAFEDRLAALCQQDKYRDIAESFAAFVKAHAGTDYLAFEPIPEFIRARLVEKTQSPSAVTTLTLRQPNWVSVLHSKLHDPAAFANFVTALEADVTEIAKTTKKLH
jgi:hypothetical protein